MAQREKATSVLKDKVWTFIYFALTVILCARDCFKRFTYINTFDPHNTPISHTGQLRQRAIKSLVESTQPSSSNQRPV